MSLFADVSKLLIYCSTSFDCKKGRGMALLSHLLVERKDGLLVDIVAGGDDQVRKVGQAILLRHAHKRLLHNPETEFMNVQSR